MRHVVCMMTGFAACISERLLLEKNARILLANSKSLSFSTLIFGKAQERLN
jgi:hypothetical protein